jgi:hypothetical protein
VRSGRIRSSRFCGFVIVLTDEAIEDLTADKFVPLTPMPRAWPWDDDQPPNGRQTAPAVTARQRRPWIDQGRRETEGQAAVQGQAAAFDRSSDRSSTRPPQPEAQDHQHRRRRGKKRAETGPVIVKKSRV